MFACFSSLTSPLTALVAMAETFTPRFEVVGPLVMLDVSGVTRLFGTPREMADQMRRASKGPVRIAIAPTQTAAALVALGRPGVIVIDPDRQRDVLAQLPVSVLGAFERIRLSAPHASAYARGEDTRELRRDLAPPNVGEMEDVLPYFHHSLQRTTEAAAAPHRAAGEAHLDVHAQPAPPGGGWTHPRDAHAAASTRRPRRAVTAPRELEHPAAFSRKEPRKRNRAQELAVDALLDTLRRWGVRTLGDLAVLPAGDVYERLGARGVMWQRLARGEDSTPLVPWVPEDPFEASLDLEWPIEGLEPLSFVLGRLFDPLAERLERADRGAAILHTHLRLVDKTVHARTVQLPSPMRDPKTLRTLVLLDLESNPPGAAIDGVRVLIEPTPARVTQWALFERAQASPEQVSTLLARLAALMGESHVGSPRLVDSWKPETFEMTAFAPSASASARGENRRELRPIDTLRAVPSNVEGRRDPAVAASGREGGPGPGTALRRFRLPVPARVQVQEGRPVRITTDRRGVTGGMVVQSAGPWRTSGEWWNDGPAGRAWNRDEWDVALGDGTVYRIFVERDIGQWFLEGVID
jgi:protein ImuB